MRKVNRGAFPVPSNLSTLYADVPRLNREHQDISTGLVKKAKGNIYAHDNVKLTLQNLYRDKCYICEKNIKNTYQIEHYLPYSIHFPERAYDWDNLHLSCDKCNKKKIKNQYKLKDINDEKKVLDILILNPCVDNVEQLITFDEITCKAVDNGHENIKSKMTEVFLNEPEYLSERQSHISGLIDLILSDEWQTSYNILRHQYVNHPQLNLDYQVPQDNKIGDLCHRILKGYLSINSPYYTFTRTVFYRRVRLNIAAVKKFGNEWCVFMGIAPPTT
ncbi:MULTISPECIES: HNH endonuclease [Aeromonas]|uniref:HNH endonuclease n=1 Tax=Aeromonas TaxID=642 RepID=UPI00214D32F5|nr:MULTISPECIES: HNH endonuclease [Aeromonas]MCR3903104.1 HNH endonuclease [Aeromonas hydrophila]MCX4116184.1 HNH endonuclease [Aeromonas hydrophila]